MQLSIIKEVIADNRRFFQGRATAIVPRRGVNIPAQLNKLPNHRISEQGNMANKTKLDS